MNVLRVGTIVSTVLMAALLGTQLSLRARAEAMEGAAGDRVLTGELVATDVTHNRFRLVGHAGSFVAPAGISVEALDGKPVEAELTSNGHVLRITQMPIAYEPITHSYTVPAGEVISGELELIGSSAHTFTVAGTNRTFVAPARLDVRPYAGRMVDVRLDERGQVTDVSTSSLPPQPPLATACAYGGHEYPSGASICRAGYRYRCENGQWRGPGSGSVQDTPCAPDTTMGASAPNCIVGDARVVDPELICGNGTLFRCADGASGPVGSVCR
jgi:hypothetical protein